MRRLTHYITLALIVITATSIVHLGSAITGWNLTSNTAMAAGARCTYVSPATRPLTTLGDKGSVVKQIQCLMNNYASFKPGLALDGKFGAKTAAAVRVVQECARTHGLPATKVDGKVGPQTWQILYNQPAKCGTKVGPPYSN